MREPRNRPNYKIAVDLVGLMELLSVGRRSAETIAAEAEAVFRVGKRRLYNVKKIEEYMNKISKSIA